MVDRVGTCERIQAQYEQEKQADHEPYQLTITALLQPDPHAKSPFAFQTSKACASRALFEILGVFR